MNTETFLPIDAAVPGLIVAKEDNAFSWSARITDGCITIGVIYTLAKILVKAGTDVYREHDVGNGILLIAMAGLISAVLYRPLMSLITVDRVIPIYSIQTLTNSGHVSNILGNYRQPDKRAFFERIAYNFNHPTWTPDIKIVINQLLTMIYGSYQIIYDKLDDLSDSVNSLRISVEANTKTLVTIIAMNEKRDRSIAELKTGLSDLRLEMRAGFTEIKDLMAHNVMVIPLDAN
jgi:hypothetical protein